MKSSDFDVKNNQAPSMGLLMASPLADATRDLGENIWADAVKSEREALRRSQEIEDRDLRNERENKRNKTKDSQWAKTHQRGVDSDEATAKYRSATLENQAGRDKDTAAYRAAQQRYQAEQRQATAKNREATLNETSRHNQAMEGKGEQITDENGNLLNVVGNTATNVTRKTGEIDYPNSDFDPNGPSTPAFVKENVKMPTSSKKLSEQGKAQKQMLLTQYKSAVKSVADFEKDYGVPERFDNKGEVNPLYSRYAKLLSDVDEKYSEINKLYSEPGSNAAPGSSGDSAINLPENNAGVKQNSANEAPTPPKNYTPTKKSEGLLQQVVMDPKGTGENIGNVVKNSGDFLNKGVKTIGDSHNNLKEGFNNAALNVEKTGKWLSELLTGVKSAFSSPPQGVTDREAYESANKMRKALVESNPNDPQIPKLEKILAGLAKKINSSR